MNNKQDKWLHLYGNAEGTTYNIIYNDNKVTDKSSRANELEALLTQIPNHQRAKCTKVDRIKYNCGHNMKYRKKFQ